MEQVLFLIRPKPEGSSSDPWPLEGEGFASIPCKIGWAITPWPIEGNTKCCQYCSPCLGPHIPGSDGSVQVYMDKLTWLLNAYLKR